jgi:16S rRNA (cytosine1402-N4)-methyltransferase
VPVLKQKVLDLLKPEPGSVIADCTIGEGGHAEAILEKISPGGMILGIDKDPEALEVASKRLERFGSAVKLTKADFKDVDKALLEFGIDKLDGILLDLGLSSLQLEKAHRGFSIKIDADLDMRMDSQAPETARDLVNKLGEDELDRIIKEYGEERYHRRVARAIVRARREEQIRTTGQLSRIILKALPYKWGRRHPATRVFQALRIAVNGELSSLEDALGKLPDLLKKGARACIISYHSLEDRRVKNCFKDYARSGLMRIITKKPVTPEEEETAANPRSRSAKLRAAERC